MNTPEWTKPALIGVGIGAVAMAIVGFSWGGWVTGSKADAMANNRAQAAVVAALSPICVEQAKADPLSSATLAKLKDTSTYQRGPIVMEAGWATMPGSASPDRAVANACMETLAQSF
jgi:dienelactone hydrolase